MSSLLKGWTSLTWARVKFTLKLDWPDVRKSGPTQKSYCWSSYFEASMISKSHNPSIYCWVFPFKPPLTSIDFPMFVPSKSSKSKTCREISRRVSKVSNFGWPLCCWVFPNIPGMLLHHPQLREISGRNEGLSGKLVDINGGLNLKIKSRNGGFNGKIKSINGCFSGKMV